MSLKPAAPNKYLYQIKDREERTQHQTLLIPIPACNFQLRNVPVRTASLKRVRRRERRHAGKRILRKRKERIHEEKRRGREEGGKMTIGENNVAHEGVNRCKRQIKQRLGGGPPS